MLIFFIIIFGLMLMSNPEYIPYALFCFAIPVVVCIIAAVCASDEEKKQMEETSRKRKEKTCQTEEEFNEMCMTTMYANYYLDQDDKNKKD